MPTKRGLTIAVKEYVRKRDEGGSKEFLFGSDRIDLRRVSHVKFEVSKRNFKFLVDEPAGRGGTDKAPNPLAYFIAGAASCLATQYTKLAIARDMRLDDIQLTARGHFDRRIGGSFQEIVYDMRLKSPASPKSIIALSKRAERMCYAHNTLKKGGVKMVTNLYLNGKPLAVR